jgi:hypothetical protein
MMSTASSGVGGSDGAAQPIGGSAVPVSVPPVRHSTSTDSAGGVPQPRGQGTIYGGAPTTQSAIEMTMPVSMSPLENSGSLTGHILAQGWDQGRDTRRRSNVKVAVAMLLVLFALVGVSLLFLATAGTAFSDWIHGIFNR